MADLVNPGLPGCYVGDHGRFQAKSASRHSVLLPHSVKTDSIPETTKAPGVREKKEKEGAKALHLECIYFISY